MERAKRRWLIRAWPARCKAQKSVRVRMRTSVLTLVVLAPRPEISERALAAINALHQRHPSRAIVVSPGDFDGPAHMDAHIYAECKLNDRAGAEMCTEQILIKTGGELSQHLARVVTPLLIHDLPVVLWWPDDPPFGTRQFTRGRRHRRSAARRLGVVQRGRRQAHGRPGHGRGQRRVRHGHRLAAPDSVARAAGRHVRSPAAAFRSSTTSRACASMWPGQRRRCASPRPRSTSAGSRSRLGWEVARPLHAAAGRTTTTCTARSAAASARSRSSSAPVRATLDGAQRAAGSLVRVDIEAIRPRATRPRPDYAPGRPPACDRRLEWRPGVAPRRPARAIRRDAVHRRGARLARSRSHLRRGAEPRSQAGQWLTSASAARSSSSSTMPMRSRPNRRRRVVAALSDAVAQRGVAHIALTGGSAAVPLYKELRKPGNRAGLDWTKVHLWWGDDRFVPIDHPQSNAGVAYELLLDLSEEAGHLRRGRPIRRRRSGRYPRHRGECRERPPDQR